MRTLDLKGPEGNVFHIAAVAQSWCQQIVSSLPNPDGTSVYEKRKKKGLLPATTTRIRGEYNRPGSYEDALDTFDLWFKDKIAYEFLNDPREECTELEDW